jgi:hypothetical protein
MALQKLICPWVGVNGATTPILSRRADLCEWVRQEVQDSNYSGWKLGLVDFPLTLLMAVSNFPHESCLPQVAHVLFIFICICTTFLNSWITITLFDFQGILWNVKFTKTKARPFFIPPQISYILKTPYFSHGWGYPNRSWYTQLFNYLAS